MTKLSKYHKELLTQLEILGGEIFFIEGNDIPQPYQKLLVHSNDMTPTLSDFFQDDLYLEVLEKSQSDHQLKRKVLLKTKSNENIVEYGAIYIDLEAFDQDAKEMVAVCKVPLGKILQIFDIKHHGNPHHYFVLKNCQRIAQVFQNPVTHFYGRCNVICHENEKVIAHIIEILPKIE